MFKARSIACGLLLSIFSVVQAWEQIIQDSYSTLLNKFTRPMTVLEISGSKLFWSVQNAHHYRSSTWIGLTLDAHHAQCICHMCAMEAIKNVVVLSPLDVSSTTFNTLGRCEFFDVVLLHDMPQEFYQENMMKNILALGTYTIVIVPNTQNLSISVESKHIVRGYQHTLYIFETPKKGLDIARWHQHHLDTIAQPRYEVQADFGQKYMIKRGQKSNWHQGINLMTFIMLGGRLPSSHMIIGQLKQMKRSRHNDLVIGNLIVQGLKIAAIDFDDPRRNVKAKKCIKAAIKLFKGDERFKNPAAALELYHNWLKNHH